MEIVADCVYALLRCVCVSALSLVPCILAEELYDIEDVYDFEDGEDDE